ncbi:MAG: hypothetical protein KAH03_00720 [Cocleimonas sp.]|nr:hypothetical protein [Cocleimonas sp.]
MKKLPLLVATASLLTASASFSADELGLTTTIPAPQVQIYSKSFDVSVYKESEIVVKPPVIDIIDFSAEKLEAVVESGDNIAIGSIEVEATPKTCYAKIHTVNDFKLKGIETGEILATYGLHYSVNEFVTGTFDTTANMEVKFSSNENFEQKVSCNTADLKMRPFEYNATAPVDIYNDVVTVEVRAES